MLHSFSEYENMDQSCDCCCCCCCCTLTSSRPSLWPLHVSQLKTEAYKSMSSTLQCTLRRQSSLHEPVNIASALRVLSLIAAHGATKMKQLAWPPVSCGIWEREHYSCSVMVSADVSEMGKTRVVFVDMVVKWTVHILLQPCSRSKPTTRHQSQM